ncbi:MAG: type II toxin-antitoxin system Phd/YefM family antitoxin [Dehalococcoidia bacterium]
MKTIGASEFKAHCLKLLDEVGPEGILITKRGKPVAKLVPVEERRGMAEFIGILRGRVFVDPEDDLSTADAWREWTGADRERE